MFSWRPRDARVDHGGVGRGHGQVAAGALEEAAHIGGGRLGARALGAGAAGGAGADVDFRVGDPGLLRLVMHGFFFGFLGAGGTGGARSAFVGSRAVRGSGYHA